MEGGGEGSNEKVWFHRTAQANRPVKALRGGQVFGQQVVEGCKVSTIGWHGQRVGDGRLASSHFCWTCCPLASHLHMADHLVIWNGMDLMMLGKAWCEWLLLCQTPLLRCPFVKTQVYTCAIRPQWIFIIIFFGRWGRVLIAQWNSPACSSVLPSYCLLCLLYDVFLPI